MAYKRHTLLTEHGRAKPKSEVALLGQGMCKDDSNPEHKIEGMAAGALSIAVFGHRRLRTQHVV